MTHLVYALWSAGHHRDWVPSTSDVYVIAADGTGATNLTGDIGDRATPVAWRSD